MEAEKGKKGAKSPLYWCLNCGKHSALEEATQHGTRPSQKKPGVKRKTDVGVACPRCFYRVLSKLPTMDPEPFVRVYAAH